MEMDENKSKQLHNLMTRSLKDLSPDPVLSELSTQEILDALDILDRVNNTDESIKDLNENEVTLTITIKWTYVIIFIFCRQNCFYG